MVTKNHMSKIKNNKKEKSKNNYYDEFISYMDEDDVRKLLLEILDPGEKKQKKLEKVIFKDFKKYAHNTKSEINSYIGSIKQLYLDLNKPTVFEEYNGKGLFLNNTLKQCLLHNKEIIFDPSEFKTFYCLAQNVNIRVPRKDILNAVKKEKSYKEESSSYENLKYVDVLITRLKKELNKTTDGKRIANNIEQIREVGYKFKSDNLGYDIITRAL